MSKLLLRPFVVAAATAPGLLGALLSLGVEIPAWVWWAILGAVGAVVGAVVPSMLTRLADELKKAARKTPSQWDDIMAEVVAQGLHAAAAAIAQGDKDKALQALSDVQKTVGLDPRVWTETVVPTGNRCNMVDQTGKGCRKVRHHIGACD